MAKQYESKDIRNIGLFGHRGSGKTSLAEAILFDCKVTNRLGSVDAKTSSFDYTDEEQNRGFSIAAIPAWVEWKKHKINYVDTPGDLNFLFEANAALSVVDLAVMVVSASDGIGVGTEKLWENATKQNVPRILFITKLDRERTKASSTIEEIQSTFSDVAVAPIQLPLGEESSFEGIIDIIKMKAYRFAKDGSGKMEVSAVPDDMADEVERAREVLMERIAETDDELTEKFLEEMELSQEEIETGLKKAIAAGTFVPILLGAPTANIGIQPFLNFIISYAPNPLEGQPFKGFDEEGNEIEVARSADDPFAAAVFKTIQGRNGKYSIFRIISGVAHSNEDVYNSTKDAAERFGSLLQLQGKNQVAVEQAVPGDFVAVAKLKNTATGDTLCSAQRKVRFELLKKPRPIISFAMEGADEDKIMQGLNRLLDEDYALVLERDPRTNQTLVRGQGQIHIEVILEKLKNQSKLDVTLAPPSVAYKETIRGKALNVEGKLKKQSGGRGQFAVCYIDMKPNPGKGFEFENAIVGGVIPRQFIPAVEKGILEAAREGALAGYPTIDFHVRLHDGKTHDVDSSEQAFKMAGIFAFRNAIVKCNPVILEPFMRLEITVPVEVQGDITGDLNSRRGRLEGTEYKGKNVTIIAKVPEAEILSYANQLTSMTEGRGMFTMEEAGYEQVPAHIQEKLVAEAKALREEE